MRAKTFVAAAALLAFALPGIARPDPGRGPIARSGPYSLDVVDETGAVLPTFQHRGRMYVLGALGQRYLVRVRNGSGRRVEVVVSVDGRDVIDGRPAAWEKRGYLLDPHGEVTIDGYRLNTASVAAFRFSDVQRSYASRMGDARDVGVIGAAIFPERVAYRVPPRPVPYQAPSREPAAPESSGRSGKSSSSPAPGALAEGQALRDERRGDRPGLGTEFGEEHGSRVVEVRFERARARPDALLTLRYDDRQGLLAKGIEVDWRRASSSDDAWMRDNADPFRRNSFAEPPPGWGSP